MLGSFLMESTIHGLRYLVLTRAAFYRLLWLVAILCSISLAFTLVYFNVLNFKRSPTVVTTVDEYGVKDNVFFPMMTVCPKMANWLGVVEYLFNAEPLSEEEKALLDRLHVEVVLQGLRNHRIARYQELFRFTDHWEDLLVPCEDHTPNVTDSPGTACDLIFVLYRMSMSMGRSSRATLLHDEDAVVRMIIDHVIDGIPVTLTGLEERFQEIRNLRTDYTSFSLSWRMDRYLMETYTFFFDLVVTGDGGNETMIDRLQGLSEFSFDMQRIDWDQGNAGTILRFLLSNVAWRTFRSFDQPPTFFWPQLVAMRLTKFLELDTHNSTAIVDLGELTELLDLFAYGDKWFAKSLLVDSYNRGSFHPCLTDGLRAVHNPFDKARICDGLVDPGHLCYTQCRAIEQLTGLQDKIVELYTRSVSEDVHGRLDVFPRCGFDPDSATNDCFEKVVMGPGVCYVSKPGKIDRLGNSNELMFVFDKGGIWQNNRMDYRVRLMSRHHLAENKLSVPKDVEPDSDVIHFPAVVSIERVTQTTDEFRGLSHDQRKCLYSDERHLDFFPTYSQPNCALECAWKKAFADCGCAPWFLTANFPGAKVCNFFENACFKHIVDQRNEDEDWGDCIKTCLSDCETTSIVVSQGDPDWHYMSEYHNFCAGPTADITNFFCSLAEETRQRALDNADLLKYKEVIPDIEVYKKRMGVIHMYIKNPATIRIMRSASMTIIDMISNIGGTLALGCGFSLLSGFEVCYWISKYALHRVRKDKKSNDEKATKMAS